MRSDEISDGTNSTLYLIIVYEGDTKMINREQLYFLSRNYGAELDEIALDRFDKYAEILTEWNSFMNLTAITQPDEIIKKHFIDSLSVLTAVSIPEGASLIDVGTGAGFPGIPLLIARNDLKVTLLDSTNKRLDFIRAVLENIGLEAKVVHMRAEEAGKNPDFREKYDFATARAVANLRDLSEYCLPFVKRGGYFLSMKGSKAEEEIPTAKKAIHILGGEIEDKISFDIGEVGERMIVKIKKISQTPTKYPRASAKIAKFPIE